MTASGRPGNVTCLGCGCGCDDLAVDVQAGRIVGLTPPCPLAQAWFGTGQVPSAVRIGGAEATLESALAEAVALLTRSPRDVIVVLAPEATVQAHRAALALADRLGAAVDTATSTPAAAGLLAAQRRGRAAATLGELRNRADAVLFWGVDPAERYPRYGSRYAPEPVGTHVPEGRRGRLVIGVAIGQDRGPPQADLALSLTPDQEVPALSVMRAVVQGRALGELSAPLQAAADAALRLVKARYVAIVHDAEPGNEPARSPYRAEAVLALAEALNGPTRAVLSSLRAGGNRSGAEVALTWQTGYPLAVRYQTGAPRYSPARRPLADAERASAVLVAGAVEAVAPSLAPSAAKVAVIGIGPRASTATIPLRVAVDTGVAGIHEGGTAYRMDDVPLPLRPPLAGARSAADTLTAILSAVHRRLGERSP